MNKIQTVLCTALFALLSTSAQAALVATDYTNLGDTNATLDTKTGLEWLDITFTSGLSINQVTAGMSSTYAGWRLPTNEEVKTLLTNSFPSQTFTSGYDHFSNPSSTPEGIAFSELFGYSSGSFSYAIHTNGSNTYVSGIGFDGKQIYSEEFSASHLNYSSGGYAVFLVSDGGTTLTSFNNPSINTPEGELSDVSTPWGLGALSLSLLGAGFRRKKKH
jgi:hypothetical protein